MVRLSTAYDLINAAIFLPAGGSRRLRRRFVEHLQVRPAEGVLELGCGTGQVTAELVSVGADVVAVDRLPAMLAAARARAPSATFMEGDVVDDMPVGSYDVVVLAFVLHSFDAAGRRQLLVTAAERVRTGGRIGILDWAAPSGPVRAGSWRRFLQRLEPSPHVGALLDGALEADVAATGLEVRSGIRLAGGRVQALVLAGVA